MVDIERLVRSRRSLSLSHLAGLCAALGLAGCASAPITQSGALKSYQSLAESNGVLAKSVLNVNKDNVLAASTVRIMPTTFAGDVGSVLSEPQQRLVTNAVDRALCLNLSERFIVVAPNERADLATRTFITQAAATDPVAAGASKVVSAVPGALGVPVPVPRLPIGLGSLTIEAEAVDRRGRQQAAMVWARGANSFTNSPVISQAGDAYDLAGSFSADFGQLLVTGETPFGKPPKIPSIERIGAALGGKPKNPVCEAYGRDPGLIGMVANRLGAPPEWVDKGAVTQDAQASTQMAAKR
ncbi:DUF3313 domain-containing protein [Bradyrhizobium sp. 83012]|uniref:DUF3313 domain-containing protein n=1 Tax=Bradyrhizobium aeschynomenes TaxID=2734909 RepID=A0ABX2CCQ3_9BRAD|nr:DUF3313 domain-containing protein [Bradyrhizobium aeschynomenes]NPU66003.1 DUF3313 domain-containing protein [Bradyrhizobium aeschynomenes]NPU66022.1 DUF3313 domain-containing protein [Bradyrhizobium aeschynomenes]